MLQFVSWCGYYGVPGVNKLRAWGSLNLGVGTFEEQV